jgi:hypothetical protein
MSSIKEKESERWFKELLKKVVNKNASENYNKIRRRINSGEMIFFKYPSPKTPLPQLRWYDAQPLDIILRIDGRHMTCLNLHYLPRPMRLILLKKIVILNKLRIKSDMRFKLQWEDIKDFLHRQGIANLITKKYIIGRMQNIQHIKYKDWKYAAELNTAKFVFDGNYSEDDILKMVRRSQKKTKQSKNKRYGR